MLFLLISNFKYNVNKLGWQNYYELQIKYLYFRANYGLLAFIKLVSILGCYLIKNPDTFYNFSWFDCIHILSIFFALIFVFINLFYYLEILKEYINPYLYKKIRIILFIILGFLVILMIYKLLLPRIMYIIARRLLIGTLNINTRSSGTYNRRAYGASTASPSERAAYR